MIKNEEIAELVETELKMFNAQHSYGYTIKTGNEQMFYNSFTPKSSEVYVIFSFGRTEVTMGAKVLPCTISVISTANSVEVQAFLNAFSEEYNLAWGLSNCVRQIFTSPNVVSNFEEIGAHYRSIFSMSASFIISETANTCTVTYNMASSTETLEPLTMQKSVTTSQDTEAYDSSDFTTTNIKVASKVVVMSFYNTTDVSLIANVIDAMNDLTDEGVNTAFNFTFTYATGVTYTEDYKCIEVTEDYSIANLPQIVLTFMK